MIYYVDIDDTVFSLPYKGSTEYDKHIPMPERIAHFNTLFDQGHEIYYYTAPPEFFYSDSPDFFLQRSVIFYSEIIFFTAF